MPEHHERSPRGRGRDDAVVQLRVQRLDPDLPLPKQQHPDDAGYDLHAREDVELAPGGGRAIVPTGLAVAIPSGHAGFVLPRSGLALAHGVTCLNTPGLIDPLYRGELKVLLVNTDPTTPYTVHRGDRIAQLVIQAVQTVEWIEVDALDATARDTYGFGSTGR
ncbi:MAG: dUTP diphosphatase [Actinobacteria bacterium]|nr:dUTP diphosphatase [Actinomycetota bacterium]